MKKERTDFLLEINVEELPVSCVRPALDKLKNAFMERLKTERIGHGDIAVFGTAAVLICYIKDMSLKQEEISQEISGPPRKIAFDENNNPTPQAIGFAKNQGVDVKDLKIKQTPKGEYVFAAKKIKARPVKEVLQDILPDVIKSISFQKAMKWDDSGARFARPIESILVLLGKENIKIKIWNVPVKLIKGPSIGAYLKRLEKSYILNHDSRKLEIEKKGLEDEKAKLETLNKTDELTDLETLGYFKERMNKAFVSLFSIEKHRPNEPDVISIVMGDIDGFKQINDTRGHQFGNEVLKAVGKLLKASVRDSDSAARYGGEEFALGFVGLDETEALRIVEKLRSTIESTPITAANGEAVSITMSFGITSTKNARTLEGALTQADTALYEAKGKNGTKENIPPKNKTVLFSDLA